MMHLAAFPRCAAYLKGMQVRLDDASMTNYFGAVILSEKWTDAQLVEAGGVDFSTRDGDALLSRFEALLRAPAVTVRQVVAANTERDRAQLQAYLGSRGVKTSALKSDDDYLKAVHVLWPFIDCRISVDRLHLQLASMSKKVRAQANSNLKKLPPEWVISAKGGAA